jgi:outer membrane protein W
MKKNALSLAVALLAISNALFAQEVQNLELQKPLSPKVEKAFLGPTASFGGGWIDKAQAYSVYKSVGGFGLSFLYRINKHWGVGTKFMASAEGYKLNNEVATSVTPLYLKMPARAYFFFTDGLIQPHIFAGPSAAMKIAEFTDDNVVNDDDLVALPRETDNFRYFDFGLNGGAGINIALKKRTLINFDVSYYHGLTGAVNEVAKGEKNRNFMASIGVLFALSEDKR